MLKISSIKAMPYSLKMRIPYRTAFVDRWVSPAVICIIETNEGIFGVGQATTSAPRYAPHEETVDSIINTINQFSAKLIGMDPWDIAEIHRVMDRIAHGHRYAQCAVDIAIYDILGKAANVPIWKLLGGRVRDRVQVTAPHLGYLSPKEMVAEAKHYIEQGYKAINLRAGRDLREDIAILTEIRKELGEEIIIDMDFSQSLSLHQGRPDSAIRYLRELEKFGVASFEQPLASWDLKGMRKICAAIETPIYADESVFSPEDVIRIAEMEAADGIKIKMIKFAGIFGACQVANVAQLVGLPLAIGHGIGGLIQNAAETHFASIVEYLKFPGEMVGFVRMESDFGTGLNIENGEIIVPETAGLGVSVDLSLLE